MDYLSDIEIAQRCKKTKKCVLYAADVSALSEKELIAKALSAVSEGRRRKAAALSFEADRRLALGAELLLLYALKKEGIAFEPDMLAVTEHGKPYLVGQDKFFNISHSGDWVLCAVSDGEVGCDVQKIIAVDTGASRRFAPEEHKAITAADDASRTELFFRYWTLKESFMKAVGLGMMLPMNEFCIHLAESVGITQSVSGKDWGFAEFADIDGYGCAVCAEKPFTAELKILDIKNILNIR